MAIKRKPKIKWRKSDKDRITNAVRQFNGKLTRTIKKYPALKPYLPERLSVSELVNSLKTGSRNEYNRTLARIERFYKNKRSAEIVNVGNTQTTRWQLQNIRNDLQRINYRRQKRLEKISPSPEKGNLRMVEEHNLEPKRISNLQSFDWNRFVLSVERQATENYELEGWEQYKKNYVKKLRDEFGFKGELLAANFETMPLDVFIDFYESENAFLTFDHLYSEIEKELIMNQIIAALQSYQLSNEYIDSLWTVL